MTAPTARPTSPKPSPADLRVLKKKGNPMTDLLTHTLYPSLRLTPAAEAAAVATAASGRAGAGDYPAGLYAGRWGAAITLRVTAAGRGLAGKLAVGQGAGGGQSRQQQQAASYQQGEFFTEFGEFCCHLVIPAILRAIKQCDSRKALDGLKKMLDNKA